MHNASSMCADSCDFVNCLIVLVNLRIYTQRFYLYVVFDCLLLMLFQRTYFGHAKKECFIGQEN